MDNVRNMTGSPIAGIDPHEFLDVRALNYGATQPFPEAGAHVRHDCMQGYLSCCLCNQ